MLFSTHEPDQAFRYASRALALLDGRLLADGEPGAALTDDTLSKLYRVPVAVRDVEVQGEKYSVSIPHE